MTEFTKEIIEKFQVRKTKKQKSAFIEYLQGVCKKLGYESRIEKGQLGARNVVIGDPETAKVVYTAHYDTAPALPFPNFLTPKNILLYILYMLAILVASFAIFFAIGFTVGLAASYISTDNLTLKLIVKLLPRFIYIGILLLMLFGPANKHTVNDNTSGVVTLIEIMNALPEEKRSQVCFVFFDLEEMGLFGSQGFYAKHKKALKSKLVLNFDCVSDGRNMLFATKKQTRAFASVLNNAFSSNEEIDCEVADGFVFYPSDNMSFPLGIGVAAFNKTKGGILYVGRIHTKRDIIFRSENIVFLTEGSVNLVDLI